jgi:hypothetical protein
MGRQLRTLPSNEGAKETGVLLKSSTRISIPNYGVTHLTTGLTAGDWVLDPPAEGVHKYLYNVIATTGIVVRGSTGTSVTFTDAGATQIKFDGAGEKVIHLIGRSATKWLVASALSAAQSTAIVIGTS